jgi:hypothetical protein
VVAHLKQRTRPLHDTITRKEGNQEEREERREPQKRLENKGPALKLILPANTNDGCRSGPQIQATTEEDGPDLAA